MNIACAVFVVDKGIRIFDSLELEQSATVIRGNSAIINMILVAPSYSSVHTMVCDACAFLLIPILILRQKDERRETLKERKRERERERETERETERRQRDRENQGSCVYVCAC